MWPLPPRTGSRGQSFARLASSPPLGTASSSPRAAADADAAADAEAYARGATTVADAQANARGATTAADAEADARGATTVADAQANGRCPSSPPRLPSTTSSMAGAAAEPRGGRAPPLVSARRRKWQNRLSSRRFHALVLVLVLLDLGTIVADLILILTHSAYRPTRAVEEASRALAATSLAILSLFCLEFLAAIAVFGPRAWLREPLHCFDVIIVTVSLALEAALFHLERDAGLEGLVSLLVAGRLWRLLRVSFTTSEAEAEMREARGFEDQRAEVARLRRRVAALQAQLAEAGIAERPAGAGAEAATMAAAAAEAAVERAKR